MRGKGDNVREREEKGGGGVRRKRGAAEDKKGQAGVGAQTPPRCTVLSRFPHARSLSHAWWMVSPLALASTWVSSSSSRLALYCSCSPLASGPGSTKLTKGKEGGRGPWRSTRDTQKRSSWAAFLRRSSREEEEGQPPRHGSGMGRGQPGQSTRLTPRGTPSCPGRGCFSARSGGCGEVLRRRCPKQ